MVAMARRVAVDRNGRMGLVPALDLVVGHGTVARIPAQTADVMVKLMVLEVADLVGVVYRRNRPSPHRSPQEVDLRA